MAWERILNIPAKKVLQNIIREIEDVGNIYLDDFNFITITIPEMDVSIDFKTTRHHVGKVDGKYTRAVVEFISQRSGVKKGRILIGKWWIIVVDDERFFPLESD